MDGQSEAGRQIDRQTHSDRRTTIVQAKKGRKKEKQVKNETDGQVNVHADISTYN